MLRPARLSSLRPPTPSHLLRQSQRHQRRLISFAPPSQKPRSFRGGLLRWGLAGGAIYWYMTRDGDIFAEAARGRLAAPQHKPIIIETQDETEELPTVESITSARRERQAAKMAHAPIDGLVAAPSPPPPSSPSKTAGTPATPEAASSPSSSVAPAASAGTAARSSKAVAAETEAPSTTTAPSPASLEEEAESEGAFNEETGEINWDCPCLGGMAHGPCGEQFREAFSCFVFSKEEPKGIDCIERFKTMQECFREYPDVYGAELAEDELDEAADAVEEAPSQPEKAAARDSQTPDATAGAPASTPALPTSLAASPSANAESSDADEKETPREAPSAAKEADARKAGDAAS